jgi:ataxia telangiectasia mutated family protein
VKAIIEHVTQLLPVSDGEYCAGLSQFYLKVLGALLKHEAHVEHLDETDWTATVDFCLQGINNYDPSESLEDATSSRMSAGGVQTSSSGRSSASRLSVRTIGGSSVASISKRNSEELLECLLYLLSASNAPILQRAVEILHGLMHFLKSHGFMVSPVHQVAFSALNSTLSAVNTDRAFLVQSFAPDLVPIISRLWSSRDNPKDEMVISVKDEMLVTILLLRLHLERLATDSSAIGFHTHIDELRMILRDEHGRRTERDQLQLDDLDLGTLGYDVTLVKSSIGLGNVRLRPHAVRGERLWAVLKSLSVLDEICSRNHDTADYNDGDDEEDDSRHPRKRRRLIQQFDEFDHRIRSAQIGERLVALQTLLFVLPNRVLQKDVLDDLLNKIHACLVDKQGGIDSWAMLAFAL